MSAFLVEVVDGQWFWDHAVRCWAKKCNKHSKHCMVCKGRGGLCIPPLVLHMFVVRQNAPDLVHRKMHYVAYVRIQKPVTATNSQSTWKGPLQLLLQTTVKDHMCSE